MSEMTLDQFCDRNGHLLHIEYFRKSYAKGLKENPYVFPAEGGEYHWHCEHGLFIDVGGDADDPLPTH